MKDEGDGMGMRMRCGRVAGTVWRAAGALRCMALQSSPSHTPSSPPPPTNASRRAWEGAVAVGVRGAIQRRSPPERAPHLGRAPTPCRQAPTVRPSRHRLFPTPLTLRRGEVGARRRRSWGAWWGRGRRDGDAHEVRAGVGDCVASPRALTAHGASIIAISKWVGRSNMALPSFRSNAIVTLRARERNRRNRCQGGRKVESRSSS